MAGPLRPHDPGGRCDLPRGRVPVRAARAAPGGALSRARHVRARARDAADPQVLRALDRRLAGDRARQAGGAVRAAAQPGPVAVLPHARGAARGGLAGGQPAARAGGAGDRRAPRQPHRGARDGRERRPVQVADLRRQRGLHRGRGRALGGGDRVRRARLVQHLPVDHPADRHRGRGARLDLGRDLRRPVHPVRAKLGAGHLQGRTLGDLRRVPDTVHVFHAVRHRRRGPAHRGAPRAAAGRSAGCRTFVRNSA